MITAFLIYDLGFIVTYYCLRWDFKLDGIDNQAWCLKWAFGSWLIFFIWIYLFNTQKK